MKYICLLVFIYTGCGTKLVKNYENPPVYNETTHKIPFVDPVTQQPMSNSTYDITNTIILGISAIILLICFAPLILSYISYIIEIVREKYLKYK